MLVKYVAPETPRLVVVAPPLKSARPPCVETPESESVPAEIPPANVDVETFEMMRAFAVVVPAWKVPTTVEEAVDEAVRLRAHASQRRGERLLRKMGVQLQGSTWYPPHRAGLTRAAS